MSTTPQEISGLQGLLGNATSTAQPAPSATSTGGGVSSAELSGLQSLLSPTKDTEPSPEEQQSNTRQMLVAGMTGQPTPNMSDADKASFAQCKAAGAISVPAVAGMYLSAHAALAAGIPALTKALTGGALAVGAWAEEHPAAARIIWHVVGNAIKGTSIGAGAAITGKVIKAWPE